MTKIVNICPIHAEELTPGLDGPLHDESVGVLGF